MSPFLPSHVSGSWELLVFYGGLLHTPCLWWRKVGIWVIWRLRPWFYHDFIGETLWEVLKGVFWRNSPTKFIDGQVFCASCKTSNNPQENSCKIHPPRPYFWIKQLPGRCLLSTHFPTQKDHRGFFQGVDFSAPKRQKKIPARRRSGPRRNWRKPSEKLWPPHPHRRRGATTKLSPLWLRSMKPLNTKQGSFLDSESAPVTWWWVFLTSNSLSQFSTEQWKNKSPACLGDLLGID